MMSTFTTKPPCPADVKRALKAGFDAQLPKPVTLDSVTELFAKVLDSRGRHEGR